MQAKIATPEELAELRRKAFAAFADHQRDMKTDATYRREVKRQERKQIAAQKRVFK